MKNKFPLFGPNSTGRDRLPGAPKMGPWGNSRAGDPFAPVAPMTPETFEESRWKYEFPVPVIMPRTTYAPEGASTLDLRREMSIPAAANQTELMAFVCMAAATTVIYGYSLILTSGPNSGISWYPSIDDQRVLQYHGDPGLEESSSPITILNRPTSFDFSDTGLVRCQILMQPGQIMRWRVSNTTGGAVNVGIRMVGYVDLTQQLLSSKFGD